MRQSTLRTASACVFVCCSIFGLAGCADLNDEGLDPTTNDLQGTWEYLVTNAYEARFTGCTGDATVIEGATFFEAFSLAPVCLAGVVLAANQDGDSFQVMPHQVTCSDGAVASVSANGSVDGSGIGGQWESTSDEGVTAVQVFSGAIVGNLIELTETRRIFDGSFQGACDLSPPLTALVTVE